MCGIPYVLYLEVALIASDPFLVFQTIVVKTDYFFNSIWKILCGQKRRVWRKHLPVSVRLEICVLGNLMVYLGIELRMAQISNQ